MRLVVFSTLAVLIVAPGAHAESVNVAVAANFTAVAEELGPLFAEATGHEVTYSFGSTGQLYTQITQGAPFGVFLAADDERPTKAVEEGFGVEGSVFTYAVGQLALYSTSLDLADGQAVLEAAQAEHLSIADPETAPYGRAAVETLAALNLTDAYQDKLVTGENISQALQFVDSGSAELGFVAASQVQGKSGVWIVPAELHQPIQQDAVLLTEGEGNPAATAYLEFLKSPKAVAVIEAAGYAID